jgi:hypothetical protein
VRGRSPSSSVRSARGELAEDVDIEVLLDDLVAPVFHRVMMRGLDLDEAFLAWHVERTLARHEA